MFQNKKFSLYAVLLWAIGCVYMFLCAGLEGGQLELARAGSGGWSPAQVELPVTVGGFCAAALAFVFLTDALRHGVRRGMILWGAAAALGCVGLMNAQGVYWLFFASTVLLRCACTALQMGVAALCTAWFIRCRGRALGLAALGGPLFSAVGTPVIADFVRTRLDGDWRPLYLAVAVALALLALAVRFLLRDRPEDAGLYPDGDGRAPADEPEEPAPPLSVPQVLGSWRTWLALAATGALVTAAVGWLRFLEPRLLSGGPALLDQAAPWRALGAILAMPASCLFGWLCDKLGAGWTALLLALAEMGAVCVLWFFPDGMNLGAGILLCLSQALVMGGVFTVVPCAVGRVFGRQQFLPAGRVLFPLLLLSAALVGPVGTLLGGAAGQRLYPALWALAAIGALTAPFLRPPKKPKEDEK